MLALYVHMYLHTELGQCLNVAIASSNITIRFKKCTFSDHVDHNYRHNIAIFAIDATKKPLEKRSIECV